MWIAIAIVAGIILLFDIAAIRLSGNISRHEEAEELKAEFEKAETETAE